MPCDFVADDEVLYRRVPNTTSHFAYPEGRLHISSSAFNDPARKPSVDRARLRGNKPNLTKVRPTDGVVSLIARDVRAIANVVQQDQLGEVRQRHSVDVAPAPLEPCGQAPGNPAHALIVTDPALASNSAFDRLKESLARLATDRGWLVEPS